LIGALRPVIRKADRLSWRCPVKPPCADAARSGGFWTVRGAGCP
jgi:hypothetical protein